MDLTKLVVLDCEVYPDYFLIAFKSLVSGRVRFIEAVGEDASLSDENKQFVFDLLSMYPSFGFNSLNYDLPIIYLALYGLNCKRLKQSSDELIDEKTHYSVVLKSNNVDLNRFSFNHFDIFPLLSPTYKTSLKLFGARINFPKIQDLPFEPDKHLKDAKRIDIVKSYCENDLNLTIALYEKIKSRVELRMKISKDLNHSFLSKSNSQITETIMRLKLNDSKTKAKSDRYPNGGLLNFKYVKPDFIEFKSDTMNKVLGLIDSCSFFLKDIGGVENPISLAKTILKYGFSRYQLGIGGLHSMEKKRRVIPNDDEFLIEKDVASYYPSIILRLGLYPKKHGKRFLDIYKDLVESRLKAKKEGDKVANETLKIVINGSFGKFGSVYSILYSPELLLTVTLTGQLALLMLIERLEDSGISVVSANTDSFTALVPKEKFNCYEKICSDWVEKTGFKLDGNKYKALYSRDVNNYIAIKDDGLSYKGKGIFSDDELTKNPQANICIDSIKNLLLHNKPIVETVKECKDADKFLFVRSVTNGAVFLDDHLGRVVRWYYSNDTENRASIYYKKNGNKVPKSENSKPLMELGRFPDDIDFYRYVQEIEEILCDIDYLREQSLFD